MAGPNQREVDEHTESEGEPAPQRPSRSVHVFSGAQHDTHELAPLLDVEARARARRALVRPGAVLLSPLTMALGSRDRRDLELMQASFDGLTLDPYDGLAGRYRAHGQLSLETNAGHPIITRLNRSTYRQSAWLNPAEAGRERRFEALPSALFQRLLLRLVIGLFECLPGALQEAPTLDLNIHQVSYRALTGPSVATPLGLHRDGEAFTAIVLLTQHDLIGGDSVVADSGLQLLLAHSLRKPLETLLLNDAVVVHQVTPLLQGRRDVLIIDYTPKVPNVPA